MFDQVCCVPPSTADTSKALIINTFLRMVHIFKSDLAETTNVINNAAI